MRHYLPTFACLASLIACSPQDLTDSSRDDEDTAAGDDALSACVDDVGHWSFWGACAEDVPLGASTPVYASSPGTVVQVYPSCGGLAGQSIRVEDASGTRTMYAHVNAAVSVGQSLQTGTYVGTTYGGQGPVYCNTSFGACGVGQTASRPMLCWSGPHLHREAPCCGTEQASGWLVQSAFSDRCAEIASYSMVDGGAAVQWGCHGGANQRWEYVDVGGGYYELRNGQSGKCLEVYGWSTEDAAHVVQWDCHGGANQLWRYVEVGGGLHELQNAHSGKCLEVYGWESGDGARLSQWSCFGQDNQRWRLLE